MEVEILNERENPLLGRKEVKFRVTYKGSTVPRKEVRSKMIAVLDSSRDLTVLDYIRPEYGRQSSLGYVKVYADADAMKVEAKHKLKRNFEAKEEKKQESGAEPKGKQEKKAGEKKTEE